MVNSRSKSRYGYENLATGDIEWDYPVTESMPPLPVAPAQKPEAADDEMDICTTPPPNELPEMQPGMPNSIAQFHWKNGSKYMDSFLFSWSINATSSTVMECGQNGSHTNAFDIGKNTSKLTFFRFQLSENRFSLQGEPLPPGIDIVGYKVLSDAHIKSFFEFIVNNMLHSIFLPSIAVASDRNARMFRLMILIKNWRHSIRIWPRWTSLQLYQLPLRLLRLALTHRPRMSRMAMKYPTAKRKRKRRKRKNWNHGDRAIWKLGSINGKQLKKNWMVRNGWINHTPKFHI